MRTTKRRRLGQAFVIYVSAKHIKNGQPQKMGTCPIALALVDTFRGCLPEVDTDVVMITTKCGDSYCYKASDAICRFITRFDNVDGSGKSCRPRRLKFSPLQ